MPSIPPSADLHATIGRRKRPMRMRVKKYDVDASNSFITIDMAGRVENNAQNQRQRYVDAVCTFFHPTANQTGGIPRPSANATAEAEFGRITNDDGDDGNSLKMFAKVIETVNQEDLDSSHGAPSLSESSTSESVQSPPPSPSRGDIYKSDYGDSTDNDEVSKIVPMGHGNDHGAKLNKIDRKDIFSKHQNIYNPQTRLAPAKNKVEFRRVGVEGENTTNYGEMTKTNCKDRNSHNDDKDMKPKSQLERNMMNVPDAHKQSLPGDDKGDNDIFHDAVSSTEEQTKVLKVNDLVKRFGTNKRQENEGATVPKVNSSTESHSASSDVEENEQGGESEEDKNEEIFDSHTLASIYDDDGEEEGSEDEIFYPATSDPACPMDSPESDSMYLNESQATRAVTNEKKKSNKWWTRIGSAFRRRKTRPAPSTLPSGDGEREFEEDSSDEESIDEERGKVGGIGAHSRIAESAIEEDIASNGKVAENTLQHKLNDGDIESPPEAEGPGAINSQTLLFGFNKLKPVGEKREQVDTGVTLSGRSVSFAEAAAAMARSKQQSVQPKSEQDYDKPNKPKTEAKISGASLADQIKSAALARSKQRSPQPKSAQDYDKPYKPTAEAKISGESLADQIKAAAIVRSKKQNPQPQSAQQYDKPYKPNTESKMSGGSLADQIKAAAMARSKKQSSQPPSAQEYEKVYKPRTETNISGGSIADQVAALAIARKKSNSQLQTTEDYDRLYSYKSKTESKLSGGSLADQVAAAATAVKLKNRTAPKTAEEYDELYKPKAEANISGESLADQVAAAAMAVKMKNRSAPKTAEEYDELYKSKTGADLSGGSLADQVAALARKKNNAQVDYDNLYKKVQKETQEPKRMFDLKPVGWEKSADIDRDTHNQSVNSEDIESEDILCSSSMTDREFRTLNSADNVSEENLCSSYSASNSDVEKDSEYDSEGSNSSNCSSRSKFNENPVDRRKYWCWLTICLAALTSVVMTVFLVYFFVIADTRNDNQSKVGKQNSSYEPTQFPTAFQSSHGTVKPTTSSIEIHSSVPSMTVQTDLSTLNPSAMPTISNPDLQPTFPTATPMPSVIPDPPKAPVSDNTALRPTQLPSQSQQLKSSNQPTIIISTLIPTEENLSPVTLMPASTPASTLRQLLISGWPLLEESLNELFSPQREAFDWLIESHRDLDSYSREQLIQRFAMATFFISTNGYDWSNNEGWLSEKNECLWYQTKNYRNPCDASGRLVNLELDGNGISGSLPPELALLSNSLTRLDLAKGMRNDASINVFLQGALPSEIGLLTGLQFMSLREQRMTGRMPDEVGQLSLLTVLDLESNKFEGPLIANIGAFQRLNNLYLGSNKLSGALPSEFGRLRFLVNLDLSGNRFSSTIPSELGKLSYLQSLSLGSNEITGTIPSFFGHLSNLQGSLDLSNNLLEGTIPTYLGQLSQMLTVLDLSSNQLSGPIPTELDRLVSLGNLQLQNNMLTGTVPSSFFKLSHLQFLQLENNNLTGEVSKSVCDSLVTRKLQNNFSPTYLIADCVFKVTCECCQYCCSEDGCECQFGNTGRDLLCKYGDILSPGFRMVNLKPRSQ